MQPHIRIDGRVFAYVFPCAWEDYAKIGFSRDPLGRISALHRRWFEFFDLDAGTLVEAESERDARDLELQLRSPFKAHRAPAPTGCTTGRRCSFRKRMACACPVAPASACCVTPSTVAGRWISTQCHGCLNTSSVGMQVEPCSTATRLLNRRGRLRRTRGGAGGRAGQLPGQFGVGHVALQEQQAAVDVHERPST